jgi:hypothetical protein
MNTPNYSNMTEDQIIDYIKFYFFQIMVMMIADINSRSSAEDFSLPLHDTSGNLIHEVLLAKVQADTLQNNLQDKKFKAMYDDFRRHFNALKLPRN